jgi:hypothetical protein
MKKMIFAEIKVFRPFLSVFLYFFCTLCVKIYLPPSHPLTQSLAKAIKQEEMIQTQPILFMHPSLDKKPLVD